ncbi:MAG TPA: hypothetical protein DDX85_07015 [Nitrospiraceae bacterium]|nr:hypothetical protein [Nitrospiraceae bacterium]
MIKSTFTFIRRILMSSRDKIFLGLMTGLVCILFSSSLFASSATLSWLEPSTNEDGTAISDLAGYKIYYGTDSTSFTKSIDVKNVTTYQITNLISDLTYYFAITAYDFYGNESGYSNTVSFVALNVPPSDPVLLNPEKNGKGKGNGKKVGFTWQESTDPDGDTVIYQLTVCEDPDLTTGCITGENVASAASQDIYHAGMVSTGIGFLFSGMVFMPFIKSLRRRTPPLVVAAIMLFLISCGGGGSGASSNNSDSINGVSQTLSGFKSNTTYFWQVTAKDGSGGRSSSEIWNFQTP